MLVNELYLLSTCIGRARADIASEIYSKALRELLLRGIILVSSISFPSDSSVTEAYSVSRDEVRPK